MKWIYWTIIIGFIVAIFGAPLVLADELKETTVVCRMPVLGMVGTKTNQDGTDGWSYVMQEFPCSPNAQQPQPQLKSQERILDASQPAGHK